MKSCLSILIICFTTIVFAQKCDYLQDKTDKFTKKKTVVVRSNAYKEFTNLCELDFYVYSDTLGLVLNCNFSSNESMESSETDELWFSLSDGSVMKLKPFGPHRGRVKIGYGQTYNSYFQPQFILNITQINELSEKYITAFRTTHAQGILQKDIEEKKQKKIKNAINCLLIKINEN